MKDFEGQRKFTPAKLPTLGEPLQTLDITPQISQAYREKLRMDEGYIRSIEANEKQELANLDIEAANAERKAAQQSEFMNSLIAFAPSLMALGEAQIKAKIKEDEVQGKMKKFDMDFSDITELPYYQEQMASLANSKMTNDEMAAEAFRRTQNYELARVYKSLNSAERVGFAQQFLAEKRAEFPAYLAELMTSSEEEITVGGKTFKIKDADGLAENSAAAKAGYRKFLIQNGIQGMNDFFLEEHFTGGEDGARNATYKLVNKKTKHDSRIHAENNLIKEVAVWSANAKKDPETANFTNIINAVGLLQDDNGMPLEGTAKASKILEILKGSVDSGVLNSQIDVENVLRNTPDPVTGGNMLQRVQMTGALKLHVTKRNISDFRDYDASKKAAYYGAGGYHDRAMAAAERSRADPDNRMTGDEYRELQRIAVDMTGTTDKRLSHWWKHESEHGQNFQENLQMVKELADQKLLTEEIVRDALGYTPEAEQYINIAKGQKNARASTGGFSYSYKILRTAIQKASGYAGRDSEQVSGKQAYLLEDLHRQAKTLAFRLHEEEPEKYPTMRLAEQAATDITLQSAYSQGLTADQKLAGLKYSSGSNNEFDSYFGSDAVSARRQSATETVARIQKELDRFHDDHKKYGLDLDAVGAYVDTATLQVAARTYYKPDGSFNPDFRMPQGVKQLDALIPDMNQLQILEKLMKTNKIGMAFQSDGKARPLVPPPSMDPQFKPLYEKGGVDDEILNLYNNAQDTLEAIRIGASNPRGFQSALIPEPVGQDIVKDAESVELSTETVAALTQNSNNFQEPGTALPDGTMAKKLDVNNLIQVRDVLAANGIYAGHPDYTNAMIAGSKVGANNLKFTNGRFTPSEADNAFIKNILTQQAGLGDKSMLAQLPLINKAFHFETGSGYARQDKTDRYGRPAVMTLEAATAFDRMVQDSGGQVKYKDIESAQRSQEKNRQVGGAVRSKHLTGNAIDIHGTSRDWIIENGAKYGWKLNDYPGSHGGHFDFLN